MLFPVITTPRAIHSVFWLICTVFLEARGVELLSDLPLNIDLYKGTDGRDFKDEIRASLIIPRSPAEDANWIVYYRESREVVWSLEDEVVEYEFSNRVSLPREEVLSLLGMMSTRTDSESYVNDLPAIERSVYQVEWGGVIDTDSNLQLNLDDELLEIVFGFLEETQLHAPREPKDIRILFNINESISLIPIGFHTPKLASAFL